MIAMLSSLPQRQSQAVRRETFLAVAVLGVVAALGLVLLVPAPFTGDQALFSLGGGEIRSGSAFYAHFWDIKQPGVYALYAVLGGIHAGRLAVHLFDLALCLGLGVLLQRATRSWFWHPWVATVAPLLVLAPYLLGAGSVSASQIEPLAMLPLAGSLMLGWTSVRRGDLRLLALAGLLAGVMGTFKLVLVPTFAVAALAPWVLAGSRNRRARAGLVWAGAAAAPLVLVLAVLLAQGVSLGLILRTTFTIPPQVSALPGFHSSDLARSYAMRAVRVFLAPGLLAAVAVLTWRRARPTDQPAGLRGVLLLTLASAVLFTLPQRLSDYQAYLMAVPLGLLAALGLDALTSLGRPRLRAAGFLAATAAAVPLLHLAVHPARELLNHHLALTADNRRAYDEDVSLEDDIVVDDVHQGLAAYPVPAGATFYALADPIYYRAMGESTQALPFNGWSPEQMTDTQWAEWDRELRATRPGLLLIDAFSLPILEQHSPDAAAFLVSDYKIVFTPTSTEPFAATWYATTDAPGDPGPTRL